VGVVGLSRAWLLGLLALAPLAAPARASSVVDDTGAAVVLQAPARRIVTLAPHAAELVDAAGAGARLVGVIKGTDHPEGARHLPIVGDATALDLERIVMLAPDLIVTWPWTTPAQVGWLRARGVAVFEADARTIDGIADDIERIGALAGTTGVATGNAASLRRRIARLARDRHDAQRLRVFYQVSDAPLFTLGGHHLVSQAIEWCGGENVFAALALPAPQIDVEAVLAARPQVIIAGTDDARRPAWLDRWSRWPELDAVRAGNLFAVDANLLHRPGPRFVDGVAQLCRTLDEARRRVDARAYNDGARSSTGRTR
jgi:iron complex transport system substrate-binding protein